MKISNDQLAAFEADFRARSTARFFSSLASFVQEIYSEQVWDVPPSQLQARLHEAVRRAKVHGIDHVEDIADFVLITFELGEEFDTDPSHEWAIEYLRDATLSGQGKVGAIRHHLDSFEVAGL